MDRQKKSYPAQGSGGHKHHRTGRPSGNFLYEIYSSGARRLNRISNLELALLSVLAGGFMSLASFLSVLLTVGMSPSGAQYLLSGLGLTAGMMLVLLTNAALFTEANIFVPGTFYNVPFSQGFLRLFRFWSIVFLGNLVGALLFACLVYLAQEYSDTFKQSLINVISLKLSHADSASYRNFGQLLVSGMVANWVIALACFFGLASRNIMNQFIIVFLVFTFVAASNLQYFPLNVGYFSLDVFFTRSVSWVGAFFFNLIPVAIGNILGASILVAGSLLTLAKKY